MSLCVSEYKMYVTKMKETMNGANARLKTMIF